MKKIISVLIVLIVSISAVFAIELIPVEENPRIKYEGYTIEVFGDNSTFTQPLLENDIEINFSSVYDDMYDIVGGQPGSSSVLTWKKYFKSMPTTIVPRYEEPTKVRIAFMRDGDPDRAWYKDIEIPCVLQDDVTSDYKDTDFIIYSGDPDFSAFADTEVNISVPEDFYFDSVYVETIDGTPVYFEYDPDRYYEGFYTILPSYVVENNGVYELEYRAQPGKYKFYGVNNNDIIIKEFEIFE